MRLLARWNTIPPEGSFEPALAVLSIAAVLALGWVVWEFYLRDKSKD
jgi:hypothetical protein